MIIYYKTVVQDANLILIMMLFMRFYISRETKQMRYCSVQNCLFYLYSTWKNNNNNNNSKTVIGTTLFRTRLVWRVLLVLNFK